LISSQLNSWL